LKFEALSLLNANEELRQRLETLIFGDEANGIHWLSLGRKNNSIGLHFAPLDVGTILQHSFFTELDTLVLTSATLSTEGHFNYFKGRLGLGDTKELLLGTPFDYQRAAVIYLASDIPEPGRTGYQKAVSKTLISLCHASQGRCLVLFTSHAALRATQTAMQKALEGEDIRWLSQEASFHAAHQSPYSAVGSGQLLGRGRCDRRCIECVGDGSVALCRSHRPHFRRSFRDVR